MTKSVFEKWKDDIIDDISRCDTIIKLQVVLDKYTEQIRNWIEDDIYVQTR